MGVDFICRRGILKTLLCTPHKISDKWIICASKYRGTIYLCEFYTDEREQEYVNETAKVKQISSWGFKFEQYMVAGILNYVYEFNQVGFTLNATK